MQIPTPLTLISTYFLGRTLLGDGRLKMMPIPMGTISILVSRVLLYQFDTILYTAKLWKSEHS